MPDAAHDLDVDSLVLIVVGAHLRAEIDDRPLAYRLGERITQRIEDLRSREGQNAADPTLRPLICTDVWYLNNQELLARPVIALGEPGCNAATAYLSNRLPTALVVDHTLRIHLDPEFIDPQACLWGVNAKATGSAIDVFVERYLDDFLRQAML